MTFKTRYFVISSLLVLIVGLGTGLLAYYAGRPALPGQLPAELTLVPQDASFIAYADVRAVMVSQVRQKLLQVLPTGGTGHQQLEEQTGINLENDIDRLVACISPLHESQGFGPTGATAGMLLARGRFNDAKIESLMREHGAQPEIYKGKRIVVASVGSQNGASSLSVGFLEPGLVAAGNTELIRRAVDLSEGGSNVTTNSEMMDLATSLEGDAWAVGRFDLLTSQTVLPSGVSTQIPPITWFSASGRVNGGLSGVLRAHTRDQESAAGLRDIVQGLLAFARIQSGSRPELKPLLDSVQLGGEGKTVTISFDIAPETFDALTTALQGLQQNRGTR
jgi:hypothetical protein